MSTKDKNHKSDENLGQAISTTEHFLENNKKNIFYTLAVIAGIVALSLAYQHLYRKPRIQEALSQSFVAEQFFRADSFAKALNGDGNSLGFKDLIDEYGSIAGKGIYFYAGTCELNLGNYKEALKYFKKYKSDDPIIQARAYACIADSYAFLNENKDALKYYLKAGNLNENPFSASYLLKAGITYEELGNNSKAIEIYQQIKDTYPNTMEGYEIDKYISRIKVKDIK